jgi:hypothetical protein
VLISRGATGARPKSIRLPVSVNYARLRGEVIPTHLDLVHDREASRTECFREKSVSDTEWTLVTEPFQRAMRQRKISCAIAAVLNTVIRVVDVGLFFTSSELS